MRCVVYVLTLLLCVGCNRGSAPTPVAVTSQASETKESRDDRKSTVPGGSQVGPTRAVEIPRRSGPITCALIDPDKESRVSLLEAKLLGDPDPNTNWVERAAIDRVLEEQRLQALFSPQGVGDRAEFGPGADRFLLRRTGPMVEAR